MKNAVELARDLVGSVDFAVNEECFEYDECDALEVFVSAGKPVFQVEYSEGSLDQKANQVCPQAKAAGFETLIKRLDLDAGRYSCP